MSIRLTRTYTGSKEAVLVYGASSSVGAYAVQLAKRAGYTVIGVAGSSSDYAKSLGADIIVDYRGKSDTQLVSAQKESLAEPAEAFYLITEAFAFWLIGRGTHRGHSFSLARGQRCIRLYL